MLWDLIRDFFVEHVFGGHLSNHNLVIPAHMGIVDCYINGEYEEEIEIGTTSLFKIAEGSHNDIYYISLGDWLSTTATAISITIIVVFCCLFVYKIIKLIGGLIR